MPGQSIPEVIDEEGIEYAHSPDIEPLLSVIEDSTRGETLDSQRLELFDDPENRLPATCLPVGRLSGWRGSTSRSLPPPPRPGSCPGKRKYLSRVALRGGESDFGQTHPSRRFPLAAIDSVRSNPEKIGKTL